MKQPCPACGAASGAFSAHRSGSDRKGKMVIMRLRCDQSHEWQIRMHEDLYALRRARRYDEHAARLTLHGRYAKGGKPPIERFEHRRVEATPAVMRTLADVRSARGWWE